jgi:hypothetical protein
MLKIIITIIIEKNLQFYFKERGTILSTFSYIHSEIYTKASAVNTGVFKILLAYCLHLGRDHYYFK